jgi:hypothetical protein
LQEQSAAFEAFLHAHTFIILASLVCAKNVHQFSNVIRYGIHCS